MRRSGVGAESVRRELGLGLAESGELVTSRNRSLTLRRPALRSGAVARAEGSGNSDGTRGNGSSPKGGRRGHPKVHAYLFFLFFLLFFFCFAVFHIFTFPLLFPFFRFPDFFYQVPPTIFLPLHRTGARAKAPRHGLLRGD